MRKTQTIIVTGVAGQVGQALMAHQHIEALNVIGLSRNELDITKPADIAHAINHIKPNIIINAAGYTHVDQAESCLADAKAVNAIGPQNLAKSCKDNHITLLHLSTDYVFDGKQQAPYHESDPIHPLNNYGKTKVLGEEYIRSTIAEHLIIRTSGIFSPYGRNFVKNIIQQIRSNNELSVVNDQFTKVTSAASLTRAIYQIVLTHQTKPTWGTFHFCCEGTLSWYEFAEFIVKEMKKTRPEITMPKITPVSMSSRPMRAKRPQYSVLNTNQFETVFQLQPPNWQAEAINTLKHLTFS